MNYKIKKFHVAEIISILLILSSDLLARNDDELIDFAEQIEGRIDVLFTEDYLCSLKPYWTLEEMTIYKLVELKNLVVPQYSSQWHTKLREGNKEINIAKQLAKSILIDLNIE